MKVHVKRGLHSVWYLWALTPFQLLTDVVSPRVVFNKRFMYLNKQEQNDFFSKIKCLKFRIKKSIFLVGVLSILSTKIEAQNKSTSYQNQQPTGTYISYDKGWYELFINNKLFSSTFYDDFIFHNPEEKETIPYSPNCPYLQEPSENYWYLTNNNSGKNYISLLEGGHAKVKYTDVAETAIPLMYNPMSLASNDFDIRVLIDKTTNANFSGIYIGSRNMHDGIHISIMNIRDRNYKAFGYDFYDDGIVKNQQTIETDYIFSELTNELRVKKEGEDVTVYINGYDIYHINKSELKNHSSIGLLASGSSDRNLVVFNSCYVNIISNIPQLKTNTESNIVKIKKSGTLFLVPVTLNNVLNIDFIFDSGASDVSVSPDVAMTLIKTGTIKKEDWLEGAYYQLQMAQWLKVKDLK